MFSFTVALLSQIYIFVYITLEYDKDLCIVSLAEMTKIRSLFGCTLIFTASLTIFIIIVITCQPHQLGTNSSSSASNTDDEPNDDDEEDSRLLLIRNSLKHASSSFITKHGASSGFRTRDAKHSGFFGLHHAFPLRNSDIEHAFDVEPGSSIAFQKAVRVRVDKDGVLFLASVDSSYVTMALNLFLTSFQALNITNYLFVGTDEHACHLLASEHPVACVRYFADRDGNRSSNWGSPGFRRKTHYKTKIVLDSLRLKVTPVIVDVDIVFFKNPLPFLACKTCDLQIQSDVTEGNSGFYMARPTKAAIELHEKALTIGAHNPRLSNQKTLGRTIDWMTRQRRIRVRTLHRKLFPCGTRYFEEHKIMFSGDGSCPGCVLVHNNWIVSQEAKMYRFRETGLWEVDSGGYYSDPNRKYLAYDNPLDLGPKGTLRLETDALKSALAIGALLNRTVILPTFHCHGCKYAACNNTRGRCALNTFYKIADFDRYFAGQYREHVFLDHRKVPDTIKRGLSDTVLVKSDRSSVLFGKTTGATKIFRPGNATSGATTSELLSWFGEGDLADIPVLRFHSLYGAFEDFHAIDDLLGSSSFGDLTTEGREVFTMRSLALAFKVTDYRQY